LQYTRSICSAQEALDRSISHRAALFPDKTRVVDPPGFVHDRRSTEMVSTDSLDAALVSVGPFPSEPW